MLKRLFPFLILGLALLTPTPQDLEAQVHINGSPLRIVMNPSTQFQVYHSSLPGQGQIFPTSSETGSSGIFARVDGVIYGYRFANPWTIVSAGSLAGSGTPASPYSVTTVLDAGTSGLRLTQTTTYVNGENFFRLNLLFSSSRVITFDSYVAADIYLASSDRGIPLRLADSGAVGGRDCLGANYNIFFVPLTPASRYVARQYFDVWEEVRLGDLSNTITSECEDNGAALQWKNLSVAPNAPVTVQTALSFGQIPTITQFRVDSLSPSSLRQGESALITARGIGFQGGMTFDLGSGVTITNVSVQDSTRATFNAAVSPTASTGFRTVSARQSSTGPTSNLPNGFEVRAVSCTVSCNAIVPGTGTVGTNVSFTATAETTCASSISYLWTFGDGTSASQGSVSKSYAAEGIYQWAFTASAGGQTCNRSGQIVIGGACTAPPGNFLGIQYNGPVSGCNSSAGNCTAGEQISFSPAFFGYNIQSCDSFLWQFGDGTSSTVRNPTKAYASNGAYTVALRVSNVNGQTSTTDLLVVGNCSAPTIQSQPQDASGPSGVAVLSVTAGGTGPFQYQWYRGASGDTSQPISGATSSSFQTPPLAPGQPSASYWVRVSNSCGGANSRTVLVSQQDECSSLALNAVAISYRGATTGCAPSAVSCVAGEAIQFTSDLLFDGPRSCFESVAARSTFSWNFGDGSTSTARDPVKIFSGGGPFNVTLTVTHPSGQRSAAQLFEFAPRVVVTELPRSIVGAASGGGTAFFTLQNVGGSQTTVTLTKIGSFFTQTPESFTLAAGASQQVTITALATANGRNEGASVPSGSGVPSGTFIPVVVLGVPAPAGDVVGIPVVSRVDIRSPVGSSLVQGSAAFTNTGSAALTGVLASSAPWLIPSGEVVTIPPGASANAVFTIDPNLRPDGGELGTATATLSLVYRLGTNQLGKHALPVKGHNNSGSGTAETGVSHTSAAATQAGTPPPLASGEVAIFLPGIAHVRGSVGTFISDLTLTNLLEALTLPNIRMFFRGAGSTNSTLQPAFDVRANSPRSFRDVARTVFENTTSVGSLQLRGAPAGSISATASVFNSSNPAGTYGTSIPAFRSDRSTGANGRIFLTGLTSSPTTHTNLYLQEASGNGAGARIDFYNAQGIAIGTRSEFVDGFGILPMNTVVPAGAVSAVITTTAESAGRLLAYATPVDRASGDTWAVVDWPKHYGYDSDDEMLIPVAGSLRGAGNSYFRTDAAFMNSGTAVGAATVEFHSRTGSIFERQIALPPSQSIIVNDILVSMFNVSGDDAGYIVVKPTGGNFVVTSRTYTTVAGQPATFGSGVPTLALASGIRLNEKRSFGGIHDAKLETVQARRPGTFRTNAGLVETAGQAVTVRATLRFTSGSQRSASQSIASENFQLGPGQFLQINGISQSILGASRRSTLGDLSDMQLEFEVIAGNGSVVPFTSTLDNGTGDSILRVD